MKPPKEDLKELRQNIDQIDQKIISAIQDRAKIAKKIGEIKSLKNEPIYRPDREREIYKKIQELSKGPLSDKVLFSIYSEIMSGTIALEKGISVGYLGPEGSFSYQALRNKFGSSTTSKEFGSIPDVFKAVESGDVNYGVVPIENSSEGLVNSTYDRIMVSDLQIVSEVFLKIDLCLMGKEKDLDKIKNVYSIRIAISQCKEWLNANLKNVKIIETSSTANAAEIVSKQESSKESAAIGSVLAAEKYNLNIIRRSIQDLPNNTTRFLVIGKDQANPTDKDKTSIVFSISHKPGSLYLALESFYKHKINLTKIESRPTRINSWEYNFFVDFYGHKEDKIIRKVLKNLEKNTVSLRILGSYPATMEI